MIDGLIDDVVKPRAVIGKALESNDSHCRGRNVNLYPIYTVGRDADATRRFCRVGSWRCERGITQQKKRAEP